MTRKDYVMLADAMRNAAMQHKGSIIEQDAIANAYLRIISTLQKENANFTRSKFCAAVFNGKMTAAD